MATLFILADLMITKLMQIKKEKNTHIYKEKVNRRHLMPIKGNRVIKTCRVVEGKGGREGEREGRVGD